MPLRPRRFPDSLRPTMTLCLVAWAACPSSGPGGGGPAADLAMPLADMATAGSPDLATADLGCPPRTLPSGGSCVPCNVVVPTDQPTISAAITASPSPGTVCILAGTYNESLTLRPHVSLVGAGASRTWIQGSVSVRGLPDADATPTALRDLGVRYPALAALTSCDANMPTCVPSSINVTGKSLSLLVERAVIEATDTASTSYCADIETFGTDLNITVRDSVCRGERGLRLLLNADSSSVVHALFLIERNRFEPIPPALTWTFDPVAILLHGPATGMLPAGSQVRATVRNNEFLRTRYEGVYLALGMALQAADRAAAQVVVVNNTLVSDDGKNAIWDNSLAGGYPLLVSANNLFQGLTTIYGGRAPSVDVSNQIAAANAFVDLAGGNLQLAAGANAIDKGDATLAPSDDKNGRPRPIDGTGSGRALPDVGAHEYVPGK